MGEGWEGEEIKKKKWFETEAYQARFEERRNEEVRRNGTGHR